MIKVRLRERPLVIPEEWADESGLVYLDLPDDFDIQEFKQLTELTPENEFSINYTINSSLLDTPKNFELLKNYLIPNTVNNNLIPLKVDVFMGSSALSDVDLYIKDYNDGLIEVEFKLDKNHWVNRIRKLLLKDLDLGTFQMTWNNIALNYINNIYEDDALPIIHPLVDWGRMKHYLERTKPIPLEYMRPMFYTLPVMRQIFCVAGLELRSPLLESTPGRMLIDYLTDPDYGTLISDGIATLDSEHSINDKTQIPFQPLPLEISGQYCSIPMPVELTDNGGHVSTTLWKYDGASGEIDLKAKVYLTVSKLGLIVVANNPASTRFPKLNVIRYDTQTNVTEIIWSSDDINQEKIQYEFDIDLKSISLTKNDRLTLAVNMTHNSIIAIDPHRESDIDESTYVLVKGVRAYDKEGDEIELAKMIKKDLDALTYLKDKTRQFNLKWWLNLTLNQIYCGPPYECRPLGELVEGFWIETNVEDIAHLIDQSSIQVTNPELNRPRYVRLAYAESTDPLVPKDYFAKKLDLGDKYTVENTEDLSLKVFSATQVAPYGGNDTARTNAGKRHPFTIPIIRSKKEVEHHWDVQPRSLLYFGNYVHGDGSIPRAKVNMNNVVLENIPTAGMLSRMINGTYVKWSLIFGWDEYILPYFPKSEVNYNLYDLFHKRDLLEKDDNQSVTYLTWLDRNKFQAMDLRQVYSFPHFGRTHLFRIQEIKSFSNRIDTSTPVLYIPFKKVSNLCDLDLGLYQPPPPDLFPCQNNLWVEYIEYSPGCYQFIVNGESGSLIEGVRFEYREEGSTEWIVIESEDIFFATLCKTDKSFYVRGYVTTGDFFFRECPDIYTGEVFIGICNTEFELTCEVVLNNEQYCYTPKLTDQGQTYTVEYFYKIDGEAEWVEYDNICLGQPANVEFKAIIQVAECEPLELTSACSIQINCTLNDVGIICESDGGDCYKPVRYGQLTPGVEIDDYILYSYNDGDGWSRWIRWDEVSPICHLQVKMRRIIIFCNGECPMICTPPVTCECGEFEGSPSNRVYCNDGDI